MEKRTMQENLKRYFYSGVGLISSTRDIIQKSAKEISTKGKMNEADGKKIIDNAMRRIEDNYNEAIHKLGSYANMEIGKLKNQVSKTEKKLAMKERKAMANGRTTVRTVAKKVKRKASKGPSKRMAKSSA